jgi:PHD/YefM family antitoxin component YafN of YafNO toxin-antitoxin module
MPDKLADIDDNIETDHPKNGQGDLAVMSIEMYEALAGKLELYRLLDEGRAAVKAGRKRPLEEVIRKYMQ